MDDYKNILNDDDFISTESKTDNIIKVIGVGGGGGNAVNHMYKQNIEGVSFVVCNTDKADLDKSPVPTRVQIGKSGLGAGAQPEKARKDAEESVKDIENLSTAIPRWCLSPPEWVAAQEQEPHPLLHASPAKKAFSQSAL